MKKLIGKTGRVLKAVACRASDQEEQGRFLSAFEIALKDAVNQAVQQELEERFKVAA